MIQLVALAKTGLIAAQMLLSGVCLSSCRYERMGVDGYWESRIQACVCRSILRLEDGPLALKLEQPLSHVEPVPVERPEAPQLNFNIGDW